MEWSTTTTASVGISSAVSDMVHTSKHSPQKHQLLPSSRVLRTLRIVGYGLIQNEEGEADWLDG